MKRTVRGAGISAGVAMTLLVTGCAMQLKEEAKSIERQPTHCATADGDIRVLQSEKVHVAEQIAMGVTAIYPAGMVMGILTGTEGTKLKVASGEYNQMIDKKIAEIRSTCGL